ncbi:RNA polymerase II transcription factor-like protein [Lojkania enalia]|uniref:RNA polymerase II transcription factor-like protein n=1 Tax=Lojkania enalia TaxID=147567 RepID=A0A9P4KBJ9_9PLEO|nr:RNA polymerase II transcription factor-like protein [Didymosphaeria enalia]
MSEASAQYRRQDGTLSLAPEGRTVSWQSSSGAIPGLTIAVSDISNLQQTPATSAKASIKIVVQKPLSTQPDNYTFTFTSASARDDQQATTSALRKWIEASKVQTTATPTPRPVDNGGSQSATMAIAQTASGSAMPDDEVFSDSKLVRDVELQKSLLNSSPALRQRFDQALRDKPETITISQLATQFWATRVHLLRSHAAERSQNQGTYNVLSVVKPRHVDGAMKLNMTKEQIQLIFVQHPLIKKVYNENVPPLTEGDFWSRFFHSRLCRKLKGEKINTDTDPVDPKFDKYLNFDDDADSSRQLAISVVPHFIDLAGNEQNHSQRYGNKPDWTMQPNSHDKVPILRVLNRMSEKMMADVPPSDIDRHGPAGVDEGAYNELVLRDLQRGADDNRVVLKIQNQDQMFSAEQSLHTSSSASTYMKRTPTEVLSMVQQDFRKLAAGKGKSTGINLEAAIGVEEDSSSDEECIAKKQIRVGSKSARSIATSKIMKSIRKRNAMNDDYLSSQAAASIDEAAKLGLSQTAFDSLAMTHNTTVEFLHYFWSVYLSGDPDRANEAARLVETLDKSLDRIKAVADQAECEREAKVNQLRRENEIYTQRTGKKRKFDPASIKGGAAVINDIIHPLKRAIATAAQQYKKVYDEQLRQQSVQGLM